MSSFKWLSFAHFSFRAARDRRSSTLTDYHRIKNNQTQTIRIFITGKKTFSEFQIIGKTIITFFLEWLNISSISIVTFGRQALTKRNLTLISITVINKYRVTYYNLSLSDVWNIKHIYILNSWLPLFFFLFICIYI